MAYSVLCLQVLGAVCGWALDKTSHDTFTRIWLGGAVATFPGFVLGLVVQWQVRAAALSENATLIRRMGLVTVLLSLVAVAMLLGVLPANARHSGQ